jgi:hypothetical protein
MRTPNKGFDLCQIRGFEQVFQAEPMPTVMSYPDAQFRLQHHHQCGEQVLGNMNVIGLMKRR